MEIDGSCHCGEITYKAKINPDKVMVCHCTDCQTLSGSAFRVVVFSKESNFRLTHGEPKIYIKIAESGRKREQVFCNVCGTQLYATSVGDEPRYFGLRVGTIRQRDQLKPSHQKWARSRQSWVDDISQMPKTETQ